MSDTQTTEAVTEASTTPPAIDPPVVETQTAPAPKPTPKRASRTTETRRMSEEQNNGTPSAQPTSTAFPADLVQKLAQYESLKAESAKLAAERDATLKSLEEMKTSVASFQEKFGTMEAESKKLAAEKRSLLIAGAVRDAARDYNAVDPDEVTELLSKRFTLDEAGTSVIAADDTKKPVKDYLKDFAEKKPHLFGRKVASGSGASPYPAQSAPSGAKPDLTTASGMTAFARGLK